MSKTIPVLINDENISVDLRRLNNQLENLKFIRTKKIKIDIEHENITHKLHHTVTYILRKADVYSNRKWGITLSELQIHLELPMDKFLSSLGLEGTYLKEGFLKTKESNTYVISGEINKKNEIRLDGTGPLVFIYGETNAMLSFILEKRIQIHTDIFTEEAKKAERRFNMFQDIIKQLESKENLHDS